MRNHATPPDSATRTLQAAAAVPDPLARRWLERVLGGESAAGVIGPAGTKPAAAEGERIRK